MGHKFHQNNSEETNMIISNHSITVTKVYFSHWTKPSTALLASITSSNCSAIIEMRERMGENAQLINFYCSKLILAAQHSNRSLIIICQLPTQMNQPNITCHWHRYPGPDSLHPDLASKLHQFSTTNHLGSDHVLVQHFLLPPASRPEYDFKLQKICKAHVQTKLKDTSKTLITTPKTWKIKKFTKVNCSIFDALRRYCAVGVHTFPHFGFN